MNKQKNIAILISGEVRTFVLKEQRIFFQNLITYLKQYYTNVDVFIVLKIPDDNNTDNNNDINNKFIQSFTGIKNFKKIINILQPKYLYCFYDFIFKYGFTKYNVQLKLLDMCIESAIKYEKNNNINYDTYFRIRPDSCLLLKELDILNKNNNYIYTSIKSDSFANDQIIIINKFFLYEWWIKYVRIIINNPLDVPPEYRIYNRHTMYLKSNFQNWLIRSYDKTINWDKGLNKLPLSSEYTFKYINNYNKLCVSILHSDFIEEIKKIPNIVLDTYINYIS